MVSLQRKYDASALKSLAFILIQLYGNDITASVESDCHGQGQERRAQLGVQLNRTWCSGRRGGRPATAATQECAAPPPPPPPRNRAAVCLSVSPFSQCMERKRHFTNRSEKRN